MQDVEPQYSLALIRAELGSAMANLKAELARDFALKTDLDKLTERQDRTERWVNRLMGAVAFGVFAIPLGVASIVALIH